MSENIKSTRDYIYDIIQIVPKGSVIYYGQIGEILQICHEIIMRGQIVGWAMGSMKKNLKSMEKYNDCNWQRVVAKTGSIATFKLGLIGNLQVELLEMENVKFDENYQINMDKYSLTTKNLLDLYETYLRLQTKL
jgi:alkylated DNA nucleotide flippase Atl1